MKIRRYGRIVVIFLIMAALIAGMSGCFVVHPTPPCGSQNLEISDWYDLDSIRDNLCGNHILMNDLDSTTAGYEELAGPMANGGRGWVPIGWGRGELILYFKGTFDGQGYEIRDLFINRPGWDMGFFGISGGVIEDIGVVNATIVGVSAVNVGALVGDNFGTVSNSYSTGTVTGNWSVGGLVGDNTGTVRYSYSAASVTGIWMVGGLVGLNWGSGNNDATVRNSYSTGNVTGINNVGGLVGRNLDYGYGGSTIRKSYSTGTVTGNLSVGGLVGENKGNVIVSFWDTETSGQSTSDGGTGKNTTEMQDIMTFSGVGWNIITVSGIGERNITYIWNIVNNVTYPFLSWQS